MLTCHNMGSIASHNLYFFPTVDCRNSIHYNCLLRPVYLYIHKIPGVHLLLSGANSKESNSSLFRESLLPMLWFLLF